MNNKKMSYFFDSALRYFTKISCPYCQSQDNTLLDRKYLVTRIFECNICHLYHRHPYDKFDASKEFYESDYIETGLTTNLPSDEEIVHLKQTNFKHTEKDYSDKIEVIKSLYDSADKPKILDYGTSWGYASYQFSNMGFEVQSFEISKQRASFGKNKLGIEIISNEEELEGDNDIFFSSHVIEHHPAIKDMVILASRLLKTQGYFIAYAPNGSPNFRKDNFDRFTKAWGLVHPNYINVDFYKFMFRKNPFIITSSPHDLDMIKNWDKGSQLICDTSGDELLVIARPNIEFKLPTP